MGRLRHLPPLEEALGMLTTQRPLSAPRQSSRQAQAGACFGRSADAESATGGRPNPTLGMVDGHDSIAAGSGHRPHPPSQRMQSPPSPSRLTSRSSARRSSCRAANTRQRRLVRLATAHGLGVRGRATNGPRHGARCRLGQGQCGPECQEFGISSTNWCGSHPCAMHTQPTGVPK